MISHYGSGRALMVRHRSTPPRHSGNSAFLSSSWNFITGSWRPPGPPGCLPITLRVYYGLRCWPDASGVREWAGGTACMCLLKLTRKEAFGQKPQKCLARIIACVPPHARQSLPVRRLWSYAGLTTHPGFEWPTRSRSQHIFFGVKKIYLTRCRDL